MDFPGSDCVPALGLSHSIHIDSEWVEQIPKEKDVLLLGERDECWAGNNCLLF